MLNEFLYYMGSPYIWVPRIMFALLGFLAFTGYLTLFTNVLVWPKTHKDNKLLKIWKLWLYTGMGAACHLMLALFLSGIYPFPKEFYFRDGSFLEAIPFRWLWLLGS